MKNLNILRVFTFILFIIFLTACPPPAEKCVRTDNVGYWDLDVELNKVYGCPPTRFYCMNNVTLSEFVILYDLPNPWDIVTTSQIINNKTFTIADQNQIIQTAKNTAEVNAPNCISGIKKSIYGIQFIRDFITEDNDQTLYVIKIQVTYACCSGSIPK